MIISNDTACPIKGKNPEKEQFIEILFSGSGGENVFWRKLTIFLFTFLIYSSTIHAQYIKEILEYRPAPGQFINKSGTGTPEAALSIIGEDPGLACLGSAGGYIIFRFDSPVINNPANPYGVDFTLFGNSLPEWSEPAAVYVMKDENGNFVADDKWYLLAGSDYYFSTGHSNHQVTYYQPAFEEDDIAWRNNLGESGFVKRNSYHEQPYYPAELFPGSFYDDSCTFNFMKIEGKLETGSSMGVRSYRRAFGFADNNPKMSGDHENPDNPYTPGIEGYGGDAFDLSWAVNENGEYIELDTADFVRVQTAMYGISEAVGEISSELTGGRLSSPDPTLTGRNEMLVIEDVPENILPGTFQLKAYFFTNGRLHEDENINWVSNNPDIDISSDGKIEIKDDSYTEVYATAKQGEIISNTLIINGAAASSVNLAHSPGEMKIFPNPAYELIFLQGTKEGEVCIYDLNGILIKDCGIYRPGKPIDISMLSQGIYFISIVEEGKTRHSRFVKN